jgi:hypothetical protein|eukprot:4245935-Prymnesium_polylepis.1
MIYAVALGLGRLMCYEPTACCYALSTDNVSDGGVGLSGNLQYRDCRIVGPFVRFVGMSDAFLDMDERSTAE